VKPSKLNIVLAVLLVIVLVLPIVTRVDHSRPNFEFLPEMKYSPAWSTYEPNPNFADGRTLQSPVAGTIARGQMPLRFDPPQEEDGIPGAELPNPYHVQFTKPESAPEESVRRTSQSAVVEDSTDSEVRRTADAKNAEEEDTENERQKQEAEAQEKLRASVERGGNVYRVYCICCHGAGGAGDGPVAKRGYPPPPSLLTGASRKLKDGQLFHILTFGKGNMPDFAGQLSQDARWDVINYIRGMQERSPVDTPAAEGHDMPPTEEPEEAGLKTEPDSNNGSASTPK